LYYSVKKLAHVFTVHLWLWFWS